MLHLSFGGRRGIVARQPVRWRRWP